MQTEVRPDIQNSPVTIPIVPIETENDQFIQVEQIERINRSHLMIGKDQLAEGTKILPLCRSRRKTRLDLRPGYFLQQPIQCAVARMQAVTVGKRGENIRQQTLSRHQSSFLDGNRLLP